MARNAVVPIRLTTEERTKLYEAAKPFGVSLSEFVRRAALKRRLPAAGVGEVNRETYRELCRIGNNLNQLTRAMNEDRESLISEKINLGLLAELQVLVKAVGLQTLGVSDDREAD